MFVCSGPVVIETKEEANRRLSRDLVKGKSIGDKKPEDLEIRYIVHGKTSDPFWTEVKIGIRIAARTTGVSAIC